MLYLLIVILLNTYIFVVFKLFARYNINALQAITVNYWTCVLTGLLVFGNSPFSTKTLNVPWLLYALILGVYLISLFNLISYGTAKQGMTVTTIANKLSLAIPVLFSYWLYNEEMGVLKIAGILLAIPAVYFATKQKEKVSFNSLYLAAAIFIFSGLFDAYLKYVQHFHLDGADEQAAFTTLGFAIAASIGSATVLARVLLKKTTLHIKNLIAGIVLGIPNYFSIYYFIRLFDSGYMDSSAIVPVNNIGIVIATTFVAILFFQEPVNRSRILGIILAIVAIVLIAISNL